MRQILSTLRPKWFRPKARRYLPKNTSLDAFFDRLNALNVNYVVLRWFEILPHIEPDEDVDLLVSDNDIPLVSNLLSTRKQRGIKFDLYSVSGLSGTNFRKMAYYPPHLATSILSNTVLLHQRFKVPDHRHHLLSLAYHALYHKGYTSGLPSCHGEVIRTPEHDYAKVLESLDPSRTLGIQATPQTLEEWATCLSSLGWQPRTDTLAKLSRKNAWIRDHFFSNHSDSPDTRGLAVYLVRRAGKDSIDVIEKRLQFDGFTILYSRNIAKPFLESAKRDIRGGDWEKGPWPLSGGEPVHVIAVVDVFPWEPNPSLREKHIGLSNYRVYKSKLAIRDMLNQTRAKHQKTNPIHSSDNGTHAVEYLESVCPDALARILGDAARFHIESLPPYPIIRTLPGTARRARVYQVNYKGQPAVAKVFRPGSERFLERERNARKIAIGEPWMVPVLETGANYLILEWIEDFTNEKKERLFPFGYRVLPLATLFFAERVIEFFIQRGYEYIDFSPKNMLIDRAGKIQVIDFEFLQPVEHRNQPHLVGNYAWYTVPSEFSGDLPEGYRNGLPYRKWRRELAIPLWLVKSRFRPVFWIRIVRFFVGLYLVQRDGPRRFKKLFFGKR